MKIVFFTKMVIGNACFIILFIGTLTGYAQKGNAETDFFTTQSQIGFLNKGKRYINVLGGLALSDDQPGIHVEFAGGYQPGSFGVGASTSFIRIPKTRFFQLDYCRTSASWWSAA